MRSVLLLGSALLVACGAPGELPPHRLELSAIAAAVVPVVETRALDVGTSAARDALWYGWGSDEQGGEGTFAWGGGDSSRLRFWALGRRSRWIRLRGWSYPFSDGAGVEIEFLLNGQRIGRRTLPPVTTTLRLELPESALAVGENFLELSYSRHHESATEPPWAAGWDVVQLDGARREAGALPEIDATASRVLLPAGSGLEWTLELPHGAFVAWDAIERRGGAWLRVDSGTNGRMESGRRIAGEHRFRLSPLAKGGRNETQLTRLLLSAGGDEGAVELRGLRLHLPDPPAVEPPASATPGAMGGPPPNLVVYLIDTLRADRLGCYGYPRPTTPRIDRFAAGAVKFSEGRAQSSWTRPGIATILTGLPPWVHGVETRASALPETIDTLAERLQAAGYETALFTTNPNIVPRFGFDQGWDRFDYLYERNGRGKRHVSSRVIHRAVVDWLGRRDPAKPFFLFVHTLDPHDPYRPPEEFRRRFAPRVDVESACCGGVPMLDRLFADDPAAARRRAADASDLYDAEVAENDASFGALLDELDARRLTARTAVLLTSDHGEEFLDHGGWKHGSTVFEEMLRVPFVLRLPEGRRAGEIETAPAEQIDVAPTFLALAGLPADSALPGRSVDDPVRFREPRTSTARLVRAEVYLTSAKRGRFKAIRARGEWIPPLGRPPWRLFDLADDPRELVDLAIENAFERKWLEGELHRSVARDAPADGAAEVAIDPELDRTLRALGYI
ncbi:MAG: sulfatase [Thermoanaerobaculia bacterium]